MGMITAAQIKAIAGKAARTDLVAAIVRGWPDAVRVGKIDNTRRAAHFLAQIMTETGGLTVLSESGAYRYETILKIFGAREYSVPLGGRGHSAGITPNEARRIAALPVAQRGPVLFDRVYGIGNPTKAREFGHTKPGQGWIYRGGGMMQCTGLRNYARRAKETGLPLVEHPELLHNPDSAFKAAYLEWAQDGRCNAAADRNKVTEVRQIINGGQNGIAHTKVFLVKALDVLRDYHPEEVEDDEPAAPSHDEPLDQRDDDFDPVPMPEPRPAEAPPNVQPVDPAVRGDPVLYDVQRRLKRRRYPPGWLDGKWGSGTSGALSGFMNDRGNRMEPAPTSLDEFHDVADDVIAELLEAETEMQPDGSIGWYRPVSQARANAEPAIVKELAPETVPGKRNLWTAISGGTVALLTSIWQAFSGYVSDAWDFFTDHQDVIDDHPGVKSAVWGYVTSVPPLVWLLLVVGGFAFMGYNSWRAIETSKLAIKNGERQ